MKLPKISYVNYRKEFPNMSSASFSKWFSFKRLWGGKLVYIGCKGRELVLDFRRDWVADMMDPSRLSFLLLGLGVLALTSGCTAPRPDPMGVAIEAQCAKEQAEDARP